MTDRSDAPSDDAFAPDLDAWDAWTPAEVARRLAGVQAPWYVAGGWAIDLFLGAHTRDHEDLEIAVPAGRFDEIARVFLDCDFFTVGDGLAWPFTAGSDVDAAHHQTWLRERATGRWRLDIFREPTTGPDWVCRRDDRIRMPYEQVIQTTPDGIPYGRPEVIVLFKAKAARPKDDQDLAAVVRHLEPAGRAWLLHALALVHPDHPWLTTIRSQGHQPPYER